MTLAEHIRFANQFAAQTSDPATWNKFVKAWNHARAQAKQEWEDMWEEKLIEAAKEILKGDKAN